MANSEHVERLKRSIKEWNEWRQQQTDPYNASFWWLQQQPSGFHPDLSEADLDGANLSEANLSGVNLRAATLSEANLGGARLTCANLYKAELYKANLSGADLRGTNLYEAQIRSAYLIRTDLRGADLYGATLIGARLQDADLTGDSLRNANLNGANLSQANLGNVDFVGANLYGVNFSRANLTGANLSETNITRVNFTETNLTEVHFRYTALAWVDLNNVRGLETAIHDGPSSVDINSVILPHDEPTRLHFLRGVGFTDTQIEYLPSLLTPRPIQYHSLFISYASQDEVIAQRLYTDLRQKDILCWKASHDLRPGDYHHARIDEAIHLHEKTLLLLSEDAVNSSWVKHEVQVALAREIAQDCTVLFPLRLDQAILQTNTDWAKRLRETRHIGDFTGWQDDTTYQQAFTTLLRHLKVAKH